MQMEQNRWNALQNSAGASAKTSLMSPSTASRFISGNGIRGDADRIRTLSVELNESQQGRLTQHHQAPAAGLSSPNLSSLTWRNTGNAYEAYSFSLRFNKHSRFFYQAYARPKSLSILWDHFTGNLGKVLPKREQKFSLFYLYHPSLTKT